MTKPELKKRSRLLRKQELQSKTEVFLDSGAWSAYTQKTHVDLKAYIDFIKENEQYIDVYANLDVINDGKASYKNWVTMRRAGLNPMPVYHMETPIKYLLRYLGRTDYIAIGAIAKKTTKYRQSTLDDLWEKYLIGPDHLPVAKFHGFGLTSNTIMTRYPWFSVDSTSWVQYGKYGIVLVPHWEGGKYDYTKTVRKYVVSIRSPSKFTSSPSPERRHVHIDRLKEWEPGGDEQFNRYIKEKGYILGESTYEKEKEVVIIPGLRNNHHLRDQINMEYYLDLEASLPPYPWEWYPPAMRLEI